MAKRTPSLNLNLQPALEAATSQFRGLEINQAWLWPPLPKAMLFAAVAAVALGVGWFAAVRDAADGLQAARDTEPKLKTEFRTKLAQAVNLAELRKQKEQVQEFVTQLEKQLPGKAEMDALLSDINQAGLGRGLQFELFRPGQVQIKDYYAELPIALKVSGRYHDIGAFTADVANLSRIVTLHNLTIGPAQAKDTTSGLLAMEATARTYRYLDAAEIAEVQKAKKAAAAKKGGRKDTKKDAKKDAGGAA